MKIIIIVREASAGCSESNYTIPACCCTVCTEREKIKRFNEFVLIYIRENEIRCVDEARTAPAPSHAQLAVAYCSLVHLANNKKMPGNIKCMDPVIGVFRSL